MNTLCEHHKNSNKCLLLFRSDSFERINPAFSATRAAQPRRLVLKDRRSWWGCSGLFRSAVVFED